MVSIKIPELKKQLKGLDQKELIQLIADLYKLNPEVKDYLSSKFSGEEAILELFEKAKQKVEKALEPRKKIDTAAAKKEIMTFQKVTGDHAKSAELKLLYVELGIDIINDYGLFDESLLNNILRMFIQVADACNDDQALFLQWKDRLSNIMQIAENFPWSYHDELFHVYGNIEGVYEDE